MAGFPWARHLSLNTDPNWQVKTLQETFMNIMSNFIPNKMKKFFPRDSPWISRELKTLLRRKDRLYRNYKRHGFLVEDRSRLDTFRAECQLAVESARTLYLKNFGDQLGDPNTTPKNY